MRRKTLLILLSITSLNLTAQTLRHIKQEIHRKIYVKNAIKFDLLGPLTNGEFSFYYERALTDRLSVEIGGGPAVSNLIRSINFPDPFDLGNGVHGNGNWNSDQKDLLGFIFRVGVRYYFQEDRKGLSGFYVGPEFRFRKNNYSFSDVNLSDTRTGHSSIGDINMNIGYQCWLNSGFGFNFYIGPGIGYRIDNTFSVGNGYDNNTGYAYFMWQGSKTSNYFFHFNIGLKLDVGW